MWVRRARTWLRPGITTRRKREGWLYRRLCRTLTFQLLHPARELLEIRCGSTGCGGLNGIAAHGLFSDFEKRRYHGRGLSDAVFEEPTVECGPKTDQWLLVVGGGLPHEPEGR